MEKAETGGVFGDIGTKINHRMMNFFKRLIHGNVEKARKNQYVRDDLHPAGRHYKVSASFETLRKKLHEGVDEELFCEELYAICISFLHKVSLAENARNDLYKSLHGGQISYESGDAVKPITDGPEYFSLCSRLYSYIMGYFTLLAKVGDDTSTAFQDGFRELAGELLDSKVKISGNYLFLSELAKQPTRVSHDLFSQVPSFPEQLRRQLKKLVRQSSVPVKRMKALAKRVVNTSLAEQHLYMGVNIGRYGAESDDDQPPDNSSMSSPIGLPPVASPTKRPVVPMLHLPSPAYTEQPTPRSGTKTGRPETISLRSDQKRKISKREPVVALPAEPPKSARGWERGVVSRNIKPDEEKHSATTIHLQPEEIHFHTARGPTSLSEISPRRSMVQKRKEIKRTSGTPRKFVRIENPIAEYEDRLSPLSDFEEKEDSPSPIIAQPEPEEEESVYGERFSGTP